MPDGRRKRMPEKIIGHKSSSTDLISNKIPRRFGRGIFAWIMVAVLKPPLTNVIAYRKANRFGVYRFRVAAFLHICYNRGEVCI